MCVCVCVCVCSFQGKISEKISLSKFYVTHALIFLYSIYEPPNAAYEI